MLLLLLRKSDEPGLERNPARLDTLSQECVIKSTLALVFGHMRLLAVLFLLACSNSRLLADRVWWEYGLAEVTAGYDADRDRTLVDKYYLASTGPDTLEAPIKAFVISCAQKSAIAGVSAFKATPSPEIGARVTAAGVAFKTTAVACLTTRAAAKAVADKFYPSFIRRGYWTDGLLLKFHATSPNAELYSMLHNAVSPSLPDPVNRAILLFIGTQNLPGIDIKVGLPAAGRQLIRAFPKVPQMKLLSENANQKALEHGLRLAPVVLREPQNLPHALGQEALAAVKSGEIVDMIAPQVKVAASIAADGLKAANEGVQHALREVQKQLPNVAIDVSKPLAPSIKVGGTEIPLSPLPASTKPEDVGKKLICPFCPKF